MHEYLYMTISIILIFLKISMVICCLIITYPCITQEYFSHRKLELRKPHSSLPAPLHLVGM